MWNARSDAPLPENALRRVLLWKPVTYKQVWLAAPVCAGLGILFGWFLSWCIALIWPWLGAAWDLGYTLAFWTSVTVMYGLIASNKIRKRMA